MLCDLWRMMRLPCNILSRVMPFFVRFGSFPFVFNWKQTSRAIVRNLIRLKLLYSTDHFNFWSWCGVAFLCFLFSLLLATSSANLVLLIYCNLSYSSPSPLISSAWCKINGFIFSYDFYKILVAGVGIKIILLIRNNHIITVTLFHLVEKEWIFSVLSNYHLIIEMTKG